MTTIRDVARHASVSPTTVSQVLRNGEAVHPRTRQRVEQAVDELGYRRRGVGRPSKKHRHAHIGIAYRYAFGETGRHSVTWRWFDAVQHELQSCGYHVNFFGGPTDDQSDPLFREMVRQGRLHGAIFIGGADREQDVLWVSQQSIPTLVIHRRPRRHEFSFIDLDNEGGARQVVDYLVERGHRRIGMIHRDPALKGHNAIDRQNGFRDAMAAHDLEPSLVVQTGDMAEDEICRQAVKSRTTALFCDNDGLARNILNRLHKMDVDVPGDLSIIGFDDAGQQSSAGLRPTSVAFNSDLVGRVAVNMLQQLLRHQDDIRNLSTTIGTRIVEHDTVRAIEENGTFGGRQGARAARQTAAKAQVDG